jgi:apolipoprotein N-acyltransferase
MTLSPQPSALIRFLLACTSGVLLFTAFPTYDIWPFAWVALVPLLIAINHSKPWGAFGWGALMGLITNVGGFYWIFGLLKDFAKMSDALAVPITGLLCGYQGLIFGFWAASMRALRLRWPALPVWAVAIPTLIALEFVTPFIFPWYLANSQYLVPIATQTADLFGVLGVSLVVLTGNLIVYEAVMIAWARVKKIERPIPVKWLASAAGILAFAFVYGAVRLGQIEELQKNAPTLRIGMAEGDIGIQEKNTPEEFFSNILTYQHLSKQLDDAGAELIIWPESSFQAELIWSSNADTADRLFLELDSLFVPEFRDALLPGLRALEIGFKRPFHHDPHLQHVLYQVGFEGRKKPQLFAAPHDTKFLLPGWDPLYATTKQSCTQHNQCPDDQLCIHRVGGTCEPLGTTSWSRQSIRRDFKAPIIFGGLMLRTKGELKGSYREILRDKVNRDLYNVAFLMDGEGRVLDHYKKVYLLSFGEVIPLSGYFPQLYDWFPKANRFTAGTEPRVFDFKGAKLGMMICYEDILPRFSNQLAALNPQILVNITNDAWFGKTAEPYLHLALATFRSIETRTWMVRSTNTGVSAFVDATGQIVSETSLTGAETLIADVPIMSGETTVYTRIGDVFGWLALCAWAALWIESRRRSPKTSPQPKSNTNTNTKTRSPV